MSYWFFTVSNFVLTIVCMLPTLFFALLALRVIFRRPDPVRDELYRDMVRSLVGGAIPSTEEDENQKDQEGDEV